MSLSKFRSRLLVGGFLSVSASLALGLAADAHDGDGIPDGLPDSQTNNDGTFVFVPLVGDVHKTEVSANAGNAQRPRPRVVLALGGGGARGAAHVGVLKVFKEAGIPIDGIAGTSIGAIVGGMYSAGVPLPEIEKHFTSGKLMKSFVPVSVGTRILLAPILSAPRLFGAHPYDGLYFGGKFRKFLTRAVPEDKNKIESLNIPFAAVAIDLCDGHPYSIRKGDLVSAMRASSAVPALRKPIEIDGKLLVDGGVLANVPVPHARQLGGDIVIAVQVDEKAARESPDAFRKVGSVSSRMVTLQLATLDSFHERGADIVIHPNVDHISLVSTKVADAKRGVKAGEDAAKAALPAIQAKLKELGATGLQTAEK